MNLKFDSLQFYCKKLKLRLQLEEIGNCKSISKALCSGRILNCTKSNLLGAISLSVYRDSQV